MALSQKDVDEIKPYLDKTIYKFLGFYEPSLVTAATNCLLKGYDESKTEKTLSSLLDDDKAGKLTKMIFEVASSMRSRSVKSSRKRSKDEGYTGDSKKSKVDIAMASTFSDPTVPLSSAQIKEMMANAQKLIEERKKTLESIRAVTQPTIFSNHKDESPFDRKPIKVLGLPPVRPLPVTQLISREDKVTKLAQLQANIKSRLATGVLSEVLPGKKAIGIIPGVGIVPAIEETDSADKPTPLILDSHGRTIDVTGKEVQLTHVTPTLKANIRAKKREAFKTQFTAVQQQKHTTQQTTTEAHYFDGRIVAKTPLRNKRALKFNEPGKFQQLAERMRMKAQLEKLQGEIFQIAKKTGISSAAKMALIAPKTQQQEEIIPDLEWWDSVITLNDGYGLEDSNDPIPIKTDAITHLVEHPTQMKPPTEPLKPVCVPVFLTKKERKKLRRQNRREAWKEEQEKIRLGLEPAPEPKLRISNLMRVLGNEAIQDPTKMEAHVRAQMAKRLKAHQDANASRKLTAHQKKEKKKRKMREDTSLGVHVAVYRVTELQHPAKKFKIEANAKQLQVTGIVILYKDCNIVVVEGGPRQINKFNKLMVQRIKWEEDLLKGSEDGSTNKCVLVWKGQVKQRSFGEMKFKVCPTEKIIRDFLKKCGVEHYWDHAYSGTVLDHTDDLF